MSESVALQAWRRRAQGVGEGGWRPPVRAVAVTGAVVALCGVLIGGRALNGEGASAHPPATAAPPTSVRPTCPAMAAELHADVDGDGCDEAVSYADGVLTAGAMRMRLGAPGDEVALGRWSCGPVTLALLRPATGELFLFDGWAARGRSVAAVPLGRVEGATGVHASPRAGGGCDDLVVSRSSGTPVLLPARPVAG